MCVYKVSYIANPILCKYRQKDPYRYTLALKARISALMPLIVMPLLLKAT